MRSFETDINLLDNNRVRGMLDPLVASDSANKNYVDNFKHQVFQEHFFGNLPNSWGTQNTGGGANSVLNSTALNKSFGILLNNTGTSSSGRSAIHTGQNMTKIGDCIHSFGGRFTIPVLSTPTQRFTIRKGISSSVTAAGDPTNGIYIRIVDNINSGRVQLVSRRASVESVVDSNISFTVDDWINWRVEINSQLTEISLYLGLNSQAPIFIGNIPNINTIPLNSTIFGFWSCIFKNIGTTSRTLQTDLVFYDIRYL